MPLLDSGRNALKYLPSAKLNHLPFGHHSAMRERQQRKQLNFIISKECVIEKFMFIFGKRCIFYTRNTQELWLEMFHRLVDRLTLFFRVLSPIFIHIVNGKLFLRLIFNFV